MAATEVDVRRPFVAIGERTGLCRALARVGSVTPAELAERSGLPQGYVGDWLAGLADEGFVARDVVGRYRLVQPRW